MRQLTPTLTRALWFAFLCICLGGARAGAAELPSDVDLDGDGRADLITVDAGQPFLLHIWLSATASTHTLRSTVPVVRVFATDVDGDRRPEIITRDSDAGLQIWHRGRRGFRSYRPKRILFGAIGHSSRRHVDDGPSVPGDGVSGARVGDPTLHITPFVPVALSARLTRVHPESRAPDSARVPWNAAPRPPPLFRA